MNRIKGFIKARGGVLLKLIVLFSIGVLYLVRAVNVIVPYSTGDGHEYILTTEALYNHLTPDVQYGDAVSFKKAYCKSEKWETNYKADFFDQIEDSLKTNNTDFLKGRAGLVTDTLGRHYGFHFFFYPILNVPGRFIADKLHANPMRAFQVTNAFLVILTCFFLLFFSPFPSLQTILITLAFCFTSVYWYLGWTHTEVFMISVVTLAMWFFFQEKYYIAIFLAALGGLQYQPLLMILMFMGITVLIKRGFNFKNIVNICLSGLIFLWPPVFYFLRFGTINLIGHEEGAMTLANLTYTRVFGFFFDFNQGAMLGIPLVLILYLLICTWQLILMIARKRSFDFSYSLIVFILLMTCIVNAISLLNPVGAIINRYAAWFNAIIIVHLFYIIIRIFKVRLQILFLSLIVATQTMITLYFDKFNKFDWNFTEHGILATWFLDKHPELYNPDPQIFIARTSGFDFGPNASPVIYIKNWEEVTKMAVHKDNLGNLIEYGFTKEQIDSIKLHAKFIHNWTYLNKDDLKISKTGAEIYQIERNRKILGFVNLIKNSKSWLKQIEEKAKMWNRPVDEVINADAEWLMEEREKEERARKGILKVPEHKITREEMIQGFEMQMKENPDWMKQIEEKAKVQNRSVQEVMRSDAEWLMGEKERAAQGKNITVKKMSGGASAEPKTREETLREFERQMRNDPAWMKQIESKAKAQNKTIDEIIKNDAEWLMQEREKVLGKKR